MSKSLKNPISNKLQEFVIKLKNSSEREQKKDELQLIELRNLLVDFMSNDKTKLAKDGWSMAILRNEIYKLAKYDTTKRDEFGQPKKIHSFETKVTRAIYDALLLFYQANPTTEEKDDSEKGYQANEKGELCLPFSTLKPKIKDDSLKGQEIPNTDNSLVVINGELRKAHFAKLFPDSSRKSSSGTGATDFEKVVIELNQYLLKLSNNDLVELLGHETKTDFHKHLESLENTIGKVFEKNSSLSLTSLGNVVDTKITVNKN